MPLRAAGLLASSLLDVFYPALCRACGAACAPAEMLCPPCGDEARKPLPAPFCRVCAMPLPEAAGLGEAARACGRCLRLPPPFEAALAAGLYRGALRQMIHGFKFREDIAAGKALALRAAAEARRRRFAEKAACVTHVPSHWTRRLRRGFEPSRMLARWTAGHLGLEARRLLRKRRLTRRQVGLRWKERERNMRGGVFAPLRPRDFLLRRMPMPESVLLVDDVLTTGATARACARALRRGGVKKIFVLTLARTTPQTYAAEREAERVGKLEASGF